MLWKLKNYALVICLFVLRPTDVILEVLCGAPVPINPFRSDPLPRGGHKCSHPHREMG